MKITDINRGITVPAQTGISPEGAVKAAQQGGFREVMRDINRDNCMEVLTAKSEEILRQGEVLARRYDIYELKKYKQLLTEFMQEAVRFSYEFKKRSTRDGRGKHHMYATIRRINEKLEKITQDILNNQVDSIQLIADISDINGMLVDIMA